jgi:L-xylulokinase
MRQFILVVDRGSTNSKAVVFNTEGEELFVSSYINPKPLPAPAGWWEYDVEHAWECVVQAVKQVFRNDIKPHEILGVFTAGQGNGFIPLDRTGNPFRPGIHSLDRRAAEIVSRWQSDGIFANLPKTRNVRLSPASPVPILAWFKENSAVEYNAIDKLLFSKDWITYKLSGVLGTDPTDASGAGLMDISRGTYAHDVLKLCGVEEVSDKLPEIRPSHQVVGYVTEAAAEQTGLLKGTPVLCGAHDIAAFPFGVGSLDPQQIVSVVGTWGLNLFPIKNAHGSPFVLYHTCPGYYLTGAGDGNSGGCLDIIIDTFFNSERKLATESKQSVYEYLEDMIAGREPTEALFHPFLFGSAFLSAAGAGFYGLRSWHAKADILMAVYEGIVMGHFANIQKISGHENINSMWLIGGGAKSRVFGQLFADITGLPVKIPAVNEVTARGGALNALVGLGICRNHEEAAIPAAVKAEFMPNKGRLDFYSRKFGIFNELVELNSDVWTKLNQLHIDVTEERW